MPQNKCTVLEDKSRSISYRPLMLLRALKKAYNTLQIWYALIIDKLTAQEIAAGTVNGSNLVVISDKLSTINYEYAKQPVSGKKGDWVENSIISGYTDVNAGVTILNQHNYINRLTGAFGGNNVNLGIFFHEWGHTLDLGLGNGKVPFSQSPEFFNAYRNELGSAGNQYFNSGNYAGAAETFAQLFAASKLIGLSYGDQLMPDAPYRANQFIAAHSKAYDVLKKQLEQLNHTPVQNIKPQGKLGGTRLTALLLSDPKLISPLTLQTKHTRGPATIH